jgi:AbrB family looped-hinge helix DNA binding protein
MQVVLPETSVEISEFAVSISPKGQITVPKRIRTLLGVKPKDKVAIRLEQGEVKVKPVQTSLESIYQMGGPLKQPFTDKAMAQAACEEHAQNIAREGL